MARQIETGDIANMFGFHKGNTLTAPQHKKIRREYAEFAERLNTLLPEGRAKAVAFTKLEEASMWSNKAVAELAPIVYE